MRTAIMELISIFIPIPTRQMSRERPLKPQFQFIFDNHECDDYSDEIYMRMIIITALSAQDEHHGGIQYVGYNMWDTICEDNYQNIICAGRAPWWDTSCFLALGEIFIRSHVYRSEPFLLILPDYPIQQVYQVFLIKTL